MNWYRVTWAFRQYSEQLRSELIWSSEDRILEDLALKVAKTPDGKTNPENIQIDDIVKFEIMTGGNC